MKRNRWLDASQYWSEFVVDGKAAAHDGGHLGLFLGLEELPPLSLC